MKLQKKVLEYLGMMLDYMTTRKVKISMWKPQLQLTYLIQDRTLRSSLKL